MNRFTRSIAMASARHPWRTIASWVVVLGAVFVLAGSGGGTFIDDFSAQGSQSEQAMQLLEDTLPRGGQGHRPWSSSPSTTASRWRPSGPAVDAVLADVGRGRPRRVVGDPFAGGTISDDGRDRLRRDHPRRDAGRDGQAGSFVPLTELVDASSTADLRVELGGDAVFLNAPRRRRPRRGSGSWSRSWCSWSSFGTVVAALVPIGLALVAVGAGIGGITLLASVMDVSAVGHPDRRARRSGRRRRLRAVHRRPLPGEPRGRSGQHDRPGGRDGHLRVGGGLRRRHRRHRHGLPRLHRSRRPDLDRPGHRHRWCSARSPRRSRCCPPCSACSVTAIDTGRLVRRHRPAKRAEDTAWWRFGHRVSGRPWPYLLGAVVALLAFAAPACRHADGLRQRPATPPRHDAPTGLRPARRRLRTWNQRTAAGRRRPRGAGRRCG